MKQLHFTAPFIAWPLDANFAEEGSHSVDHADLKA